MKVHYRITKRPLALLLVLVLTLSLLPINAFAAELDTHAHDADCGYIEGADCTHVCGEDCADVCVHTEHNEDCGYIEAAPCNYVYEEVEPETETGEVEPEPAPEVQPMGITPAAAGDYPVTVTNTTAGSLSAVLTTAEANAATKLTITGPMNTADFAYLRDNLTTNIIEIDISGVTLTSNALPSRALDNSYTYANGKLNNLAAVSFPSGLTSIGTYAFNGCRGLTGSLTIPDSVTSIGNNAFYNCSGFTGSLTIGNGVRSIDGNAFYNCSGFTGSLTIPNSVTTIGASAFDACSGFTGSLTIGNDVTTIGDYAFDTCSGFTGSLTIGNSVLSIGASAFKNCNGFTGSMTIPNSVTTIGNYAFVNCSGFTGSPTIPNSVTTIGASAFANCRFVSAVLPNGTVTVSADPTVDGTVYLYPAALSNVYIYAVANTGYTFSNWSGSSGIANVNSAVTTCAVPSGSGTINLVASFTEAYGISLNPSDDKTFTPAIAGYGTQTEHSVTVNNTGVSATGDLTVALSGANAGSFTLSAASLTSIAVGEGSSFTVVPKTGLSVGTYIAAVTVSNANISKNFNVSFTVTPKGITIVNTAVKAKTYDGTNAAEFTTAPDLLGINAADAGLVTLVPGTPTFSSVNAGNNISINFTEFTLSGPAAGNYTLTQPSGITSNITPKNVTITGLSASDKTYDGNTTATVTGTAVLNGNVDGANLTIIAGSAAFDNKNAGTDKTVTFSGYGLSGSAAGNYTLPAQPASTTANINPKPLTNAMIQTIAAQIYTGSAITPSVTVTDGATLALNTDYQNVTYNNNTNAGTASVVINGTGNYTGTATVNFTISPKALTLAADNKNILVGAAEPAYTYTVSGLAGSDTAAVVTGVTIGVSGFDSSTATMFTIEISGGTVSSNYTLGSYVTGTLTVTAKTPVTISGLTVQDGTYNGQGHTGVTGTASSGAYTGALEYTYTGDGITGSTTTQPSNAGSYTLTVSVPDSDLTYSGSQTYSFTINKATITITAHDKSATVGDAEPSYTYTVSGLVSGETLSIVPTFTCTPNMSAAGTYTITPSGAVAPADGNYNAIVYNNGALTVFALPKEATPNAVIDYTAEKLTGFVGSSFRINGTDYTVDAHDEIAIASSWLGTTVTIVKKGVPATSTDSDAQSLSIPARPAAPFPVGGAGQITGVNSTMEYKLSTASAWTATSGTTVAGLSAGTYDVRIKATAGAFASASASVTVSAAPTYTVTFNLAGGTHTGGGALSQTVASGGAATAPTTKRNGYTFTGWDKTFTNVTANMTVTAGWSYNSGGSSGGNGGGSSTPAPSTLAPSTPSPESQAPGMTVDGKTIDAGEVKTEGGTTTLTVNQETLNQAIETAKDNVTINIPAETSTATVELVMQNVDDMAGKDVTLTVQAGNVQYELPATAIDTAAVLAALGADSAGEVKISISISTDVSPAVQAAINNAMAANGGEVIIPPIEFKLTASYGGETYEINTFSSYVSRSVEITEEQAKKVTTAVLIEPDGTVRHIPTYVYQENGKWYYAVINSMTNSAYAMIHNEVTFTDTKGKWYEAIAGEIASRMIMPSVSNGIFNGEGTVTRAEFVSIIIRALGLPEDGDGTVFGDVSASSPYAGAIGKAYGYGLISGVGSGRFAPDKNITRQEAMVVTERAAKLAKFLGVTVSIDAFLDAADVSAWALDAVRWNVGSGLVSGSGGKLNPLVDITRAETAVLVLKMLQIAGLIDVRTPLTEQTSRITAVAMADRKETDPIIVPDNDEETPDPEGDGGGDDDSQADVLGGNGDAQAQITPQQAIQTLNNLLAYCSAAQSI